jgi:hypothetical protein
MRRLDPLQAVLICAALAAAVVAVYAPVAGFGFVRYDDPEYVIDNGLVNHGWSWSQAARCFTTFYAGNWHPLTWLSHMCDCQIYGLLAGGPHLTNLALHVLNTLLVFALFRTLTGALWRSAMVAALFGLHPLHVESVAWISERKDVLSTFFWMASVWAYARCAQELKTPGGKAGGFYALSLIFFALGLMSKPMLVTLPLILLLLDWWPLKRFQIPRDGNAQESSAGIGARVAPLLIEKVPFVALAIGSSVLTILSQKHDLYISSLSAIPFPSRLVNALGSFCHYIEKSIWPTDLGPMYPVVLKWPIGQLLGALLVLGGVTAISIREWQRKPWLAAGWCWFLVMLVPVIGVFRAGGQAMADRYTYVPLIGLFMILTWEVYDAAASLRWHRPVLAVLAAGSLGACCVLSRSQVEIWRNTDTLFARIPKTKTNNLGHANYARLLFDEHRLDEARAECEEALRIAPHMAIYENLLGNILLGQGKLDEARARFTGVLQTQPDLLEARLGLGKTFLAMKEFDGAAAQFTAVLKVAPKAADAHAGLSDALIGLGREKEGRAEQAEAAKFRRDEEASRQTQYGRD